MDNQTQPNQVPQNNIGAAPVGQMKVDVFKLDKDLEGLTEQLRNEREMLTKTFDQIRKAVRLLADLYGGAKNAESEEIDLSKFEEAGIDVSQVLKSKISEQAKHIDQVAVVHGIKSNLAEQFTHYDDRHAGAEAKNELLEDIETQLMSTIYNQINELRSKIEQSQPKQPQANAAPESKDDNQMTISSVQQGK